ncbi:MAG TPA: cytochrome c biogenesis protein CcdA [Bacteroidales bacterium]|nr:cytochrome c biogenesis protein CcdA [Bacteroidales bacterium]HRZ48491.1 cytochrome c biogenesis protein CcdA [Bacteroidales bacterium]
MNTPAKWYLLAVVMLVHSFVITAQPGKKAAADNIRWSYSVQQASDNEYDLIFRADVAPNWHLYGPYQEYKFGAGPLPMEIAYDSKANFSLKGKIKSSPKPERIYDEIFEVYINQFAGKPVFTQRIVVNTETPFVIKGSLSGQICEDLCVPFEDRFEFQIKGAKVTGEATNPGDTGTVASAIGGNAAGPGNANGTSEMADQQTKGDNLADAGGAGKEKDSSLLGFFLAALLLGIAGIFTPCVFPMIPMNIAFFLNYRGGRAKGKFLAVFYGLSIIFIYSVIGLLITVIFGAEAMNNIVTHWVTNVIFFLVFVVFAASFFGAFELVLPSKWVNKADSQADRGGLFGTFFMALTLVLVSFSCTAAFIGTILVEAADGTSLLKPFIGMLGFSVGFGVPFALLALFPSLMQKMPKAGGWMNAVKVVFGFVILAFGMKFLIIPDQTYHLGLLNRDIYLSIWVVLFTLMGLYLLGKFKFHHDTDTQHIGFFRLLLVIATFSFVVYLIPGIFGADLTRLSSLLPPKSTLSLDLSKGTSAAPVTDEVVLCGEPTYSDFLHLWKEDMKGYFVLEEAIACAKEKNKPVFVDFTGHGCSNCKVMEQTVLSDPRVMEMLKKNFIIASLYTDDRKEAPQDKWIKAKDGSDIKTIGRINKHIQETRFGTIATPLYVIIDHEGNMLSGTWQNDKNTEGFIAFLDEGFKKFRENNP